MTVKTLNGTYSSGYVLQPPTTILTIAASRFIVGGQVGAGGLTANGVGDYTMSTWR